MGVAQKPIPYYRLSVGANNLLYGLSYENGARDLQVNHLIEISTRESGGHRLQVYSTEI